MPSNAYNRCLRPRDDLCIIQGELFRQGKLYFWGKLTVGVGDGVDALLLVEAGVGENDDAVLLDQLLAQLTRLLLKYICRYAGMILRLWFGLVSLDRNIRISK